MFIAREYNSTYLYDDSPKLAWNSGVTTIPTKLTITITLIIYTPIKKVHKYFNTLSSSFSAILLIAGT